MRLLPLEEYSWHLRSCGRMTAQDFAGLKSTDELPSSMPEDVKAKLLAHARSRKEDGEPEIDGVTVALVRPPGQRSLNPHHK